MLKNLLSHPNRIFLVIVCLISGAFEAHAQPDPAARLRFLDALELREQAIEVEETLLDILNRRVGYLPASRRAQTASFFSFVMTLNGLTSKKLQQLHDDGLDIAHALTSSERPLNEQSLMADAVLRGKVLQRITESDDRVFVEIEILDVYKGTTEGSTVYIYQRNGQEGGEQPNAAADLEIGNTYLLLLSNGLYRFSVFRRGESDTAIPSQGAGYVIYRLYEMDGETLLWSGYNRRKTRRALEEVRRLDKILREM